MDSIVCCRRLFLAVVALYLPISSMAKLSADYYAGSSALSTGHWVKVKIKESGMHQITDAELRGMGFSNPENVAVYGYSATELSDYRLTSDSPDDLPAIPSIRHDGKLIFYAVGDVDLSITRNVSTGGSVTYPVNVQRNYYADYSTCFLTDALPRVEPETVPYVEDYATAVSDSWGMVHYEEELYNDETIGARFLGRRFVDEPVQTFEFDMPEYTVMGNIQIQMAIGVRTEQSRVMAITLPSGKTMNVSLSPVKADTYAYQGLTQLYSDKPSLLGSYSVKINATGTNAGGLDFLTVAYPRSNALWQSPQTMLVFKKLSATGKVKVIGIGRNTKIWSVGNGKAPRALELGSINGDEPQTDDAPGFVMSPGDYDVTADGKCAYLVAFDADSELPGVEVVGLVANQNLHGMSTPELLIVASHMMAEQAERLAQAHREAEGMDVAVVDVDDVYNEFSSGAPHLMALRRLVRMLADKEPGKLRSVLLFGAASYDNRGIASMNKNTFRDNLIPMYMREDIAGSGKLPESYASDAVVGMLDEDVASFEIGRALMSVNVGRIPARSEADAQSFVDKAIDLIKNPVSTDVINRALLMSDDGDKNGHMVDSENLSAAIREKSPSTTTYKAYDAVYPVEKGVSYMLRDCAEWVLKRGASFMAYSGHATPTELSGSKLWNTAKVQEVEYANPPFVMLATCRALYYDHEQNNLGEKMLYQPNGGAIALVGALREVYKEYNQQLNLAVGEEFFGAQPGATYGDVFRLARNRMVPDTPLTGAVHYYDLIYNTLSYNLIGDPELRLPVAGLRAEITGIDGNSVAGTDEISLTPGRSVVVKGRVVEALGGSADASFNGFLTLSIFDGKRVQSTINHDSTSSPQDVTFDEDLIYEERVAVENGEFSVTVYVPDVNFSEGVNRVSLFAAGLDNRLATGSFDRINIGKATGNVSLPDDSAPAIASMYLNDDSFRSGDIVTGDAVLYAEVSANDYGLVVSATQPGRSLKVVYDGSKTLADAEHCFRRNADGSGLLELPVSEMLDGVHSLTLKVFNNAGQSSERTISFTVVNIGNGSALAVEEYPAVDEANIDLVHGFRDDPSGRLVIKDGSGRVVFTDSNASFPYCWNLKDSDGANVVEGCYTVEAYIKSGNQYGYASAAEIVVNRD